LLAEARWKFAGRSLRGDQLSSGGGLTFAKRRHHCELMTILRVWDYQSSITELMIWLAAAASRRAVLSQSGASSLRR
jgi:hypothetical protein